MAFYPQFPAFYAYAPMPYPGAGPEFYAMIPPGSSPTGEQGGPAPGGGPPNMYSHYEGGMGMGGHGHGHKSSYGSSNGERSPFKPGYNNRKISSDSGISDGVGSGFSSRKTSSMSTVSQATTGSGLDLETGLDDVKEEEPYEEPDEDLCEKIVAQVEFYFGDANITKDKFLLKHVKRNKEGFVSLKLISSFKRVKHLTKDWRQVAEAIERKSSKLEVNDVKTKVRRLEALPEYDETTPSRTVVALNLPLERPTIEAVAEIFSVCGEIVLVRILRPGNPIPADIKPFANKHPEMTAKVCALVEFEKTEFALKAVKELNGKEQPKKEESKESEDKDSGAEQEAPAPMIVMELTAPPPKTAKAGAKADDKKRPVLTLTRAPLNAGAQGPQGPSRRFSYAGHGQQPAQIQQQHGVNFAQPGGQPGNQGPSRRISLYHNMKFTPIAEETGNAPIRQSNNRQGNKENGAAAQLNPNAPTFSMAGQQQQQQKKYSHPFRGGHVDMHHAAAAMHHAAAGMPHHAMHQHHAAMMNPMVAAAHAHAAMAMAHTAQGHGQYQPMPLLRRISGADIAASGLSLPPNVVRLPRGPEKGRGFARWCNKRMDNNIPSAPPPQPTPAPPETVNATAAAAPPATVTTSSVQNRLRKPGSRAVPIVAPPDIDSKDATQETDPKTVEEEKKEEGVVVAAVPAVAAAEPVAPIAPNANGEQSDSGNEDSGNELSEPELADQMRVQPQGPGFAAALEKEKDEEKSR